MEEQGNVLNKGTVISVDWSEVEVVENMVEFTFKFWLQNAFNFEAETPVTPSVSHTFFPRDETISNGNPGDGRNGQTWQNKWNVGALTFCVRKKYMCMHEVKHLVRQKKRLTQQARRTPDLNAHSQIGFTSVVFGLSL